MVRYLVLVVALASARLASAQAPDDTQPVDPPAVVLFHEGRALLEAGDAAAACGKFEASYKLDAAAAGTMLNLGICNEQIGKLATALKWFRRAHARASENTMVETEAATKQRTAALAARVATIKIEVERPPAGSAVTIDGAKIDEIDLGRLEIDAGHHVLEVSRDGVSRARRELDVVDGSHDTITVSLPPPVIPKHFIMVDRGKGQRHRAYLIAGGGLALLAGATVVGIVGKHNYDAASTPDEWSHWQNVVRYGGTPMFVVGAAAVTYAIVLYRRAPGMARVEAVAPVAPVIGPDRVGFSFTKSF